MKVPEYIRVWWSTENPDNMARVLKAEPYKGCYPEHFTHVLTLEAPNTRRGKIEMAWKARA